MHAFQTQKTFTVSKKRKYCGYHCRDEKKAGQKLPHLIHHVNAFKVFEGCGELFSKSSPRKKTLSSIPRALPRGSFFPLAIPLPVSVPVLRQSAVASYYGSTAA